MTAEFCLHLVKLPFISNKRKFRLKTPSNMILREQANLTSLNRSYDISVHRNVALISAKAACAPVRVETHLYDDGCCQYSQVDQKRHLSSK